MDYKKNFSVSFLRARFMKVLLVSIIYVILLKIDLIIQLKISKLILIDAYVVTKL